MLFLSLLFCAVITGVFVGILGGEYTGDFGLDFGKILFVFVEIKNNVIVIYFHIVLITVEH